MRVCDAHPDRAAVDAIHVQGDDTRIDVCDECKYAVLSFLNKPPPELGESPLAPPTGDASQKAPKRGFSFLGRK